MKNPYGLLPNDLGHDGLEARLYIEITMTFHPHLQQAMSLVIEADNLVKRVSVTLRAHSYPPMPLDWMHTEGGGL